MNVVLKMEDSKVKKNNLVIILVLYLLGLFMGALDTGIVSPARAVIQGQLGVSETVGIWMITIFTLAYAVSIPISGKLADIFGRKTLYIISIFLFGAGSLICSISSSYDSFTLLLIGRVIQAIGGGGIIPIVTAEIGTSFPPEKRGMALGLVGGIYGIANILGSSAGSFILGIAGNTGWHWLFLINVPISIFIVIGAIFALENKKMEVVKKMDVSGIIVIATMILSLMYGLTNIKFYDFANTLTSGNVYPFLIAFLVLIPVFVFIEKKAEDPVINLKYFTDKNMVLTFMASIIVGLALMGMVFVPQFAENALKIRTGAGGYFVTALGLFAGIGAPLSGKLIDKYGAKIILIIGFSFTVIGSLFLAIVATKVLTITSVLIGLFFMGLGMGFTMGTPLNYMILSAVPKSESSSALSTLSLVRSIGTALSPAIMIGFLATAGVQVQTSLIDSLPAPPNKIEIRQTAEIKPLLAQIKADKELSKKVDSSMLDIDAMMNKNSTSTFKMDNKNGTLPTDLLNELKSADVTNITDRVKHLANVLFTTNVTPEVIGKVQNGIQEGINGLATGITEMGKARLKLNQKITDLDDQKAKLNKTIISLNKAQAGIGKGITGLSKAVSGMKSGITGQKAALAKMEATLKMIEGMPIPSGMPGNTGPPIGGPPISKDNLIKAIDSMKVSITSLEAKKNSAMQQKIALQKKIDQISAAKKGMKKAIAGMTTAQSGMKTGIKEINKRTVLLTTTKDKMIEIKNEIPDAFNNSKVGYINKLEGLRLNIEGTFQTGINNGFTNMYFLVALLNVLGILFLLGYKDEKVLAEN